MKKYFSVADTISFFSEQTGLSFSISDIYDFVLRRFLTPCFRYDGMLTWEDEYYTRYRLDTGFYGYLTTHELQDDFIQIYRCGRAKIKGKVFVTELLNTVGIPDHLCEKKDKTFYVLDARSIYDVEFKYHVPIRELMKDYPDYAKEKIAEYESNEMSGYRKFGNVLDCTAVHPKANFDSSKEAVDLFEMELLFRDVLFSYVEIEAIIKGKKSQSDRFSEEKNTQVEPISTLQAIGIMAELLALEDGCYKYRKGEKNVNAKAIGEAVAARAKMRFGDDIRGFDSFNKKISEGLKALEKLEKK